MSDDNKSNSSSPVDSVHSEMHCWYDRMTFFHSLEDDSHGPNLLLSSDNSEPISPNVNVNDTPNNHNNNRMVEEVDRGENGNENEEETEHRFRIQEENELDIDEEFWRNYRERKNRWNRLPIRRRNPPPPNWTR